MEINLYSTHCPKCNVLAQKLKSKNMQYTEINDLNIMSEKGFTSVPMLEIDGKIMDFASSVAMLKSLQLV